MINDNNSILESNNGQELNCSADVQSSAESILSTVGRSEYTLDSKDCLLCPPELRLKNESEQAELFLLYNAEAEINDRCILAMKQEQFIEYYKKLVKVSVQSSGFRIAKQVLSSVARVSVSSQHKFVIPKHLQHYAGISSKSDEQRVTVVITEFGAEIWSSSRYEQQLENLLSDMVATASFKDQLSVMYSDRTIEDIESENRKLDALIDNEIKKRRLLEIRKSKNSFNNITETTEGNE